MNIQRSAPRARSITVFALLAALMPLAACGGPVDPEGDDAATGTDATPSGDGETAALACQDASSATGSACASVTTRAPTQGGDSNVTWACDAPVTPGQSASRYEGDGTPPAFWSQCLALCPNWVQPPLEVCASSVDACGAVTLNCQYQRL